MFMLTVTSKAGPQMIRFACVLQARTVDHRTGREFSLVFTGALRGKQQCNDDLARLAVSNLCTCRARHVDSYF